MTTQLQKDVRQLSLHSHPNGDRPRDSTIASEGEAVDIFDLYGSEPDQRESWKSQFSSSSGGVRDSTIGVAYGSPTKYQSISSSDKTRESEVSWSGPMGLLNTQVREELERGNDRRLSGRSIDTPDISITEVTPTPTPQSLPQPQSHNDSIKRDSLDLRNSNSSNSNSNESNPPLNQDISRLSPQRPNSNSTSRYNGHGQPRRNGSHTSGNTSTSTNTSISEIGNKSLHSIAGSSQYPGEEDDAFLIRTTYARLEKEGVHGDGWDQGIERTRGGPAIASGKRATVYPASKSGDLGEQEKQFLASLDRYGFVNEPLRNRSETRLALIPSLPLKTIPKLPSVSPLEGKPPIEPNSTFNPSDSGPSAKIPPNSPKLNGIEEEKLKRKEFERVDKWGKMMSIKKRDKGGNTQEWDWSSNIENQKLIKRIYKGIPDRWRMAAWWTLAQSQSLKGKGKERRSAEDVENDYRNTLDLPSTFDVQIDLDVPRTISGHTMFVTRYGAGQRNLWHVLHCFSQVCETCGYVQGMGPIAATLLCYFNPERAYTLLVRLHDVYGMHDIFEPGFPGLLEAFYVQERLMEWLMPEVYQSFQRNMISSSSWGTKWYITLFVNTVPFSQQLRLWDALWLDGRDVMIITSLAILWAFKDLLSSPKATFESILSLLSSYFVAEDEDILMRWIRKVVNQPDIKNKMNNWRKDWKVLVDQGKSQNALL